MTIRFLVVDGDPLVREGLALALAGAVDDGEVTAVVRCDEAVALLAAGAGFDVIVQGGGDPVRGPAAALTALAAVAPRTPIVAVVAHAGRAHVRALRVAGACAVVDQTAPVAELTAAVRLASTAVTTASARPGSRAARRETPA